MLPWILGGVIGATITAVVFYNAEESEKAEIEKEDAEAEKKLNEANLSVQDETNHNALNTMLVQHSS